MSTKLLDLEDRIITDEGEAIFKDEFFLELARSGKPLGDHKSCDRSRDIILYNRRVGDDKKHIDVWEDTGEAKGPGAETYEWMLPEEYRDLDIHVLVRDALIEKDLVDGDYVWRSAQEMVKARERGMFPFIRCLVYIRDKFRKNKVVWGVGRGSSCASLIFFLLDINRVDPVKHGIPMEEFFKPEKITDSNT